MSKRKNVLNDAFAQSKGGWKAGAEGIRLSRTKWQGPSPSRSYRLRQSFKRESDGFSITGGLSSFFGTKKFILGITLITIIIGLMIVGSLHSIPRTYAVDASIADSVPLWQEGLGSGDASAWNTVNAGYTSNCNSLHTCIYTQSTPTDAGIALTKSAIGLDEVAGKEMQIRNLWCFGGTYGASFTNVNYGWYLTRNGTLPPAVGYNPSTDPNVAILVYAQDLGTGVANVYALIQRNQTGTLSRDNVPISITNPQIGSGTRYLAGSVSPTTTQCTSSNNVGTFLTILLNFTGTSGTQNAYSVLETGPLGGGLSEYYTLTLPFFQFQGTKYYLGFWEGAGYGGSLANSVIAWQSGGQTAGLMVIRKGNPTSTIIAIPAPIEATGFFGPVISALVNLGVWILNAIMSFVGFLLPAITTAINVIGSFFGMAGLGTNIVNFFLTVADWFSKVFGTAFSTSAAAVTFIASGITLVTTVTTAFFNNAGSALASLADLFTFLIPIGNLILLGTHFSITALVTLWLFVGMFNAFKSFDAWLGWFRTTEMMFLKIFKFFYWIGDEVFKLIARLRTTAPRPAGI